MRRLSLALVLPLAACGSVFHHDDTPGVAAEGTGGARTYQVRDFDRVELAGPDTLDVRVGPAFSVRADGDSAILDQLKVEHDGDRLRVTRRDGFSSGDGHATVHVTLPALGDVSVLGSGNATVDRAGGDTFKATVAGSGTLKLPAVSTQNLKLTTAGSGTIEAAGRTASLRADIAGSGDLKARDLTASGAKVTVAGSGTLVARVDGQAKVTIMGSGDVDLGPNAKCEVKKMGSGSVRCGG